MSSSDVFPNFSFDLLDEDLVEVAQKNEQQQQVNNAQETLMAADKEIDTFIDENKNPNTRRKTESDLKIWYKWCSTINESRKMEDLPIPDLDKFLCYFFVKVKKSDGEDYEPDTLTSFQRSFDRHLRQNGKTFCIFKDREFAKSQEVLSSKRKQLRREGKGGRPNKALALTESQLRKLWDEKQLGCHSPMVLLRTVWLHNTIHFGWRARDEHRKVCLGDLDVRTDEENQEYVIWMTERGTKTRTGATQSMPERHFNPRMYATSGERCPVNIFKEYLAKRPEEMKKPNAPFYLAAIVSPRSHIWYKAQPLGENSLGKFMKSITEAANIKGKFTNHSARRTMITTLRHENVSHLDIAQLSGHKNLKSLDSYSEASEKQQKDMSLTLSKKITGSKLPHQDDKKPEIAAGSSSQFSSGFFSGAVITNCNIYLGKEEVNSSVARKRRFTIESDDEESDL